jgi:hypothetical protein
MPRAVEEGRGGEERRERGDQSDAYARHGLKGKKVRGCVVMGLIWQYVMTCNAEVM